MACARTKGARGHLPPNAAEKRKLDKRKGEHGSAVGQDLVTDVGKSSQEGTTLDQFDKVSAYCTVDRYCRRGCQPHLVAWVDLSAVEEMCRGLAPAAGTCQLCVVMAKPFVVVGKIAVVVSGSKEVMKHWPGEV